MVRHRVVMTMIGYGLLICLLLICVPIMASDSHKCKNPNRQIFPHCMFYSPDKSLWCDQSNYTEIPSVQTINENLRSKDCRVAGALFVNDSCLQNLTKDHLAQFTEITVFSGERNFVRKIPKETFAGNKRLKQIDLCKNEIEVVENGAFLDAKSIEEISLSYNRIRTIGNAFRHLRNLKIIKIEHNIISDIKNGQFQNLINLREIHLAGNKIKGIENKAFQNLRSLSHLHLDDNLIEAIGEKTFSGLEKLEVLTLSGNRIGSIPDSMGEILINLQVLDLGSNQLEKFSSQHLVNITNLQILRLQDNKLTNIPENLLKHTKCLRSVDLSSNNIQDLPQGIFNGLCNLQSLTIQNNQITTPRVQWIQDLRNGNPSFQNLNMSNNAWSCDCKALPYLEYVRNMEKTRDSLTPRLPIQCSAPKFALKSYTSLKDLIAEIKFRGKCTHNPIVPPVTSLLNGCAKCPESQSIDNEKRNSVLQTVQLLQSRPSPLLVISTTRGSINVTTTEKQKTNVFILLCIFIALLIVSQQFLCFLLFQKRRKRKKKEFEIAQSEKNLREVLIP